MNIRVIAGTYGGRKLMTPATRRTHPMSERARNALFNSVTSDIQGATVLDAFAGTGALGIEALSRGASAATFIERDRVASRCIAESIEQLGIHDQSQLVAASVANWLNTNPEHPGFDLIFADPPYHDLQFSTVRRLFGLLKPNGLMVLSHTGKGEVPNPQNNEIVVVDNRSYANAHLTFFRRKG